MSDISLKSKHPTPGYQDHAALRHLCGALARFADRDRRRDQAGIDP